MPGSDQESSTNTDDLMISGIHRIEDISPLVSPSLTTSPTAAEQTQSKSKLDMNEGRDSGQGSSTTDIPAGTCYGKSHLSAVKASSHSPRSRSLSPQSRVRVHYTDSAREALDLANKSYEKLVEESDERHHLSILLNKRDAERAELREADQQKMKQRIAMSAKEVDKSKPLHVHTGVHSHSAASPSERTTQPITVIQEHIRFAESILASPTNSESGRRSRSFSPLPPHVALSPAHQTVRPAARSRSCSPLARSPGHSATTSSRKKLAFDGEKRSNSPLLSRSGRERKAHEIRTRLTNDFIDATSHGLHHPSHRITADRMAAVSSGHDPAAASKPTEIHSPQQFTDIYTTPETDRHETAHRYGPMSSTPHKNRHEDPLRESSRLHNTRYHPDVQDREAPAVPNTPSTYIRGLQSVRSGLRKLMSDEVDAAQELMLDTSHRAENVSLRIESTINAENQLLRDQLTRERNLRKQIEADKHELQSQLLESKDRLHHLTSTLKQKDGMMKKLDQNLDDVVNGWQKYEQETKHMKNTLSHNICRLEAEVEEQKLYAATLATDLSNAVEELKRERETSRDFARDSHEQYTRCQEDLTDAKNSLASEEEKVLRLQVEVAQATESRLRVEKQLESLQSMLEQEREKFKEREEELLNKINDITSVQIAVLEQEAARTKAQEEKLEELDAKARNLEQEVETQRHLVNSKGKEVERLQSLLELTEAKHENAQRQLESKLRIELELRVSQAKDDALKRMADNEISLQQAHQRQLADVVSDHNRQLGAMRERYSNELSRVKTQFEDQVKTAESALGDAKQELEEAWTQKEAAESQREDLTSRLQAVLSLLGTVGTQATSSSKSMSHIRPSSRPSSRNSSNLLRTTTLHPQPHVYVDAFNSPKSLKTPDMDLSPNAPTRPPAPQTSNDHVYTFSSEAPRVTSNTDTSSEYIDTPQPSEPKSTGKMIEEPRQGPEHHQLYQSGQHKPECQVDDEKDHDDSGSVVSTTETFEIGENDSQYRHRRQAELQDYIKKLLNRSVGDPLIETRIDLDESHISVISGIQEHSVILHDANHSAKKKAFQQEVLQHDHTPPVKGSSKKVNPKEIASLITKYGGESKTPSTSEYLEYLKTVAVNNHTGFLKDFVNSSTLRKAAAPAAATKRDLTDSFNAPTHKPSAGDSRVKPSTPEKSTLSRQAKGKDKTKVKRHSSSRSQAVWK